MSGHHEHLHGPDHGSHHAPPRNLTRAFAIGVGLNIVFVVVEVVFGLMSDSMALLADAGHNLGDVLGLLLAWGGSVLAQKPPSARRTYGFRRASILAPLFNGLLLLLATGAVAWESVKRLSEPGEVQAGTVILVAAIGVVINTVSALLFVKGRHSDLNIRGAFLHLVSDALVSLGVVVTGVLMMYYDWPWLDPIAGLLISVVILLGTWSLLVHATNMLLDAVPAGLDPGAVEAYLSSREGVVTVHDLHIWPLSTTETALTAHLVMEPLPEGLAAFLKNVARQLHTQFDIDHTTLQLEPCDLENPCAHAAEDAL